LYKNHGQQFPGSGGFQCNTAEFTTP